jgi:type VI protein secretion system component Hcp
MERFMKLAATTALVLFGVAMVSIAANAAQVKTPPVSAPHVRVNVQDIHFTKTTDRSSPTLFKGVVNGKHIKTATITARKDQ